MAGHGRDPHGSRHDPRGLLDKLTAGFGHDLARVRGWAAPASNLSHGRLSLSGK
jgi:hypothetical protein